MENRRLFLIVLDSYGIGALPDAADFGDEGSNTLKTITASKAYDTPNMKKLGLFNIDGVDWMKKEESPAGAYGRMKERSRGKDTTIGHWEIAGVVSPKPLPVYPNGFPEEILEKFREATGREVLCNLPYSGTDVIRDYGEEHMKTGALIVYTSADSVFQIAAHEEIVPVVEKITGDHNIQTQKVSGTKQVIIKTKTLSLAKREQVNKALKTTFGVKESDITAENISSTISGEMRRDAVIAVIVATIFMLLYIWFRFKDVRFATSAVAALLHDVLVVLAFYAASRISVGTTFIACMLTIVGYSINATIVIFDRIREELPLMKRNDDLKALVNRSITYTLTRSIYTTFTTFVMVAVLYIMGVSSIKEFAAPLMVGIAGGGYSSVCITGALWYVMKTKIGGKKAAKKK